MSAPLVIFDNKNNPSFLDLENPYAIESNTHQYWTEVSQTTIGLILRSHQIESDFVREIIEPQSSIITQGTYECAVASLAMLLNIPLNDVKQCLYSLGWANDEAGTSLELLEKTAQILANKELIEIDEITDYSKPCMLIVPSINIKGFRHAIVWNGKEILDPQFHNENKKHYSPLWTPDTLFVKRIVTLKD
jgi:hypothetical protein